MTDRAYRCEYGTETTVFCFMATLLPPPERDPDGTELMASLRARISRGPSIDPRAAQYSIALAGVNELLLGRREVGGSTAELDRLEKIARDLQALARGF